MTQDPRVRRWINIFRPDTDLFVNNPSLVQAIAADDGVWITNWISERVEEATRDVRDYIKNHPRAEVIRRRVGPDIEQLLRTGVEVEDYIWASNRYYEKLGQLSPDERAELEYHQDQVHQRLRVVGIWSRRLEIARDVAGIELIATHRREDDFT